MRIGEIIKSRRLELGLTLEEVGHKVGVGKSTVRKWETGMIENMRRDKISKLAEVLDIPPSLLVGVKDKDKKEARQIMIDELKCLSDTQRELIAFAESVPEDKAARVLEVMKLILED